VVERTRLLGVDNVAFCGISEVQGSDAEELETTGSRR
jgi:hypothetical protein